MKKIGENEKNIGPKDLIRYMELCRIAQLYPAPQILLGKEIWWTEKRDGSNLRISLVDGEVVISSRNRYQASGQFQEAFHRTPESKGVIQFLKDHNGFNPNPACNFDFKPQVFGEMLTKGKSPTGIEMHDEEEFVVFDIFDTKANRFLTYTQVHQHCFHYGIPMVECYLVSRHIRMDDLLKTRDEVLKICEANGREGTVLKTFNGEKHIYAKEKLDTLPIDRIPKKIHKGKPNLPPLPESEILGAINKVHVDLGEKIHDVKIAMPMVARYIAKEADKHKCSNPKSMFKYYQQYLEQEVKH